MFGPSIAAGSAVSGRAARGASELATRCPTGAAQTGRVSAPGPFVPKSCRADRWSAAEETLEIAVESVEEGVHVEHVARIDGVAGRQRVGWVDGRCLDRL